MTSYSVRVAREGKWWVAVVDGLLGGATEATRLTDLDVEVRDLIAGLTDTDEAEIDLSWNLTDVLGVEGQAIWDTYRRERIELETHRRRFESGRLAALRALHDAGVSVRDTAALVDLSHQRVAQLLGARARSPRTEEVVASRPRPATRR